MGAYTIDEKAERLEEMKRQAFPRASLARLDGTMDPPETWKELIDQHVDAIMVDAYLRHFVDPGEKNPCPFCAGGFFGWGYVHGQGNCTCDWPGTLYHYISDVREDDDLLCRRRDCGKPRSEHIETPVRYASTPEGEVQTRLELRCPDDDSPFTHEYEPPLLVRFTRLLWVHPYDVHIRRKDRL